jgi:hypothetical protein
MPASHRPSVTTTTGDAIGDLHALLVAYSDSLNTEVKQHLHQAVELLRTCPAEVSVEVAHCIGRVHGALVAEFGKDSGFQYHITVNGHTVAAHNVPAAVPAGGTIKPKVRRTHKADGQ